MGGVGVTGRVGLGEVTGLVTGRVAPASFWAPTEAA